ncbi:ABC transporter ATP-binding protein [Butyricimonas faecihominis]|jgi:ABC-2 type transport system ATP-binding protein
MDVAIVKVENLSHRYSSQWAIQDISFEINQTGVLGLLGSNGAGKSTTMNIMCGVLKQTKGEVYINGVSLRDNPVEAKKHIGFLPQKPPLHLDLNVDEYLTHCAYLRSVEPKHIKAAVDEAKSKCGIMHFSKRLVRNLSGGYQQRLGIAQAIVHNPKFVVLDEPTNGLDPNQIVEIRNLVKEIAEERAVMLSTHILPEVQVTCNQIRMIESGKMVFSGTMDEFDNYIKPDSLVVLMDAPPSESELRAIPGIVSVENLTEKRFRLHFDTTDMITERVIETSVANGWHLQEINMEKSSLDVIFAKLSGKKIN